MKSSLKAGRTLITICIIGALPLNGCFVNRAYEVRDQLCDFDNHFRLHLTGTPGLQLLEPVILNTDVVRLAGAEPTETRETANGEEMHYVIEQIVAAGAPALEYWLDLGFTNFGGKLRLGYIEIDPELTLPDGLEPLDPAIVNEMAAAACEFSPAAALSGLELDIPEEVTANLPDRETILSWLGQPVHEQDGGLLWTYEFRVRSLQQEQPTARVHVRFGPDGQLPVWVETHYQSYRGRADFEAGKMSLKFTI